MHRIAHHSILAMLALLLIECSAVQAQFVGIFPGIDKMTSESETIAIVNVDTEAIQLGGQWQRRDSLRAGDAPFLGSGTYYSSLYCTMLQSIKGPATIGKSTTMSLCRLRVSDNYEADIRANSKIFHVSDFDFVFSNWIKKYDSADPVGPVTPIPVGSNALVFLRYSDNPSYPPETRNYSCSTVILPAELARAKIPSGTPNTKVKWILHRLVDEKAGVNPASK